MADLYTIPSELRTAAVEVPDVGTLTVREFSGDDLFRVAEADAGGDAAARMAVRALVSVVRPDGSPAYSADDLPKLKAAPSRFLVPIAAAVNRLNAGVLDLPMNP